MTGLDLGKEAVLDHIHRNYVCFDGNLSVGRVIESIRRRPGDGIVYYYVIDEDGALLGVLPARLLVTADPASPVAAICVREIVSVPMEARLLDVARIFERHRYLSLPVVDGKKRLVGVIDLHVFAHREIDIADRALLDEVFQTIGIRLSSLHGAGVLKSVRLRFPWLVSTMAGGLVCALLSSLFELTLLKSIILALFLSMVLAIGESTSVQSMSISLQLMGSARPRPAETLGRLAREGLVGLLLGLCCGASVAAISVLWKGLGPVALIFLSSIALSVTAACVIGFAVPWILFRFGANIKVAAGPIALALSDACTVLAYLGIASLILG